jgi:NDP-mannose synthase
MGLRAVVLAGGRGTRLKPYTVALPKPLMPVGEWPILEIIVRQLASQGFDHISLAVNHQADLMRAYFGDGSRWNVRIDYSLETQPLSTMGPLTLMKDLPEDFLVMNGDVLTDIDYKVLYEFHRSRRSIFTVSAHTRTQKIEYGVLTTDLDGLLKGFQEKPQLDYLVSMGVYIANRKVLEHIPKSTAFGFDHLMLRLIATGTPALVRNYDGYWLDIGRPDDYQEAVDVFEKNRDRFLRE